MDMLLQQESKRGERGKERRGVVQGEACDRKEPKGEEERGASARGAGRKHEKARKVRAGAQAASSVDERTRVKGPPERPGRGVVDSQLEKNSCIFLQTQTSYSSQSRVRACVRAYVSLKETFLEGNTCEPGFNT